jgi:hypothetical protein
MHLKENGDVGTYENEEGEEVKKISILYGKQSTEDMDVVINV